MNVAFIVDAGATVEIVTLKYVAKIYRKFSTRKNTYEKYRGSGVNYNIIRQQIPHVWHKIQTG